MSSFVRFIVILLIAGSAVSLGMVTISNSRSQREQDQLVANERVLVGEVLNKMSGALGRAQIVVNGQKVDADRNVVETTLLVRQFTYKQEPLPTVEVAVPGGKVCVEGVRLQFGKNYPEENKELRGKNLWMLTRIYTEGQKEADRFYFWTGWRDGAFDVPASMRVHPTGPDAHVTYFESKMWQKVWDLMWAPPAVQQKNDLKVITPAMLPSLKACTDVYLQDSRHTGFYEISVGLEGVTVSESGNVRDRTAMREEWKKRKKLEEEGK